MNSGSTACPSLVTDSTSTVPAGVAASLHARSPRLVTVMVSPPDPPPSPRLWIATPTDASAATATADVVNPSPPSNSTSNAARVVLPMARTLGPHRP
ncbi:hypothetical protein GCM10010452_03880 [Crossiella cryophila]